MTKIGLFCPSMYVTVCDRTWPSAHDLVTGRSHRMPKIRSPEEQVNHFVSIQCSWLWWEWRNLYDFLASWASCRFWRPKREWCSRSICVPRRTTRRLAGNLRVAMDTTLQTLWVLPPVPIPLARDLGPGLSGRDRPVGRRTGSAVGAERLPWGPMVRGSSVVDTRGQTKGGLIRHCFLVLTEEVVSFISRFD